MTKLLTKFKIRLIYLLIILLHPQANAIGLMADKADKVSLAVCRMLVTSNLDFDSLLDDFKREGRDKIELRLRTAFLNKMSCQSKAVIDQTVRTSRLTVDFFVQNGERDAEDLGSNS